MKIVVIVVLLLVLVLCCCCCWFWFVVVGVEVGFGVEVLCCVHNQSGKLLCVRARAAAYTRLSVCLEISVWE